MKDRSLRDAAPEALPGVRLLPVLHERVDLAALVRALLRELDPAAVAVELPTTLADAALQAVRRLPKVSVVLSEGASEDPLVWVVAPGDPLVEALRWAHDNDRPTHLIDPDVRYRERHRDPLPDPHSMWTMGAGPYLRTVSELAGRAECSDADVLRENGMAFHIQRAAAATEGELLCLVGAAHSSRVAEALRKQQAEPLARQTRPAVNLHHLHPDSLSALLPDPPLAHAVFELLREGAPPPAPDLKATVEPRVELVREGLRLITGAPPENRERRLRAVTEWAARHAIREGPDGRPLPDRGGLAAAAWRLGAASCEEQTRESTAPWQRRLFLDFARRYARVQGLLVPGLFELVVAARGVADDNLAWEVFEVGRAYPWQDATAELPTARIDGEMLDLGTRTVRFRRRFFRVKQRPVRVPVRRRPKPGDPAEWLSGFDGEAICSYPPEDVVVEDYGRFLQRKAISILSAEHDRSEPFSTSMLDGVDVRETMRRWHEMRVWVHEKGRAPGKAGSVVVIFDDDPEGRSYPYLMTWLGEHQQESDMALYATDPTAQIVGPGIMRSTYGGFMMTYPPGRLFDVWNDPDYRNARSKPEVLVLAAVDYSLEGTVVHVASKPPHSRLRSHAARQGKRLVHIPIGTLSPPALKRLRVVNILSGHDKREIARDYIW